MNFVKYTPAIVSAYPTTGTYTAKDDSEQTYESGVLFILYYEDGAKVAHHGAYKKCSRDALSDLRGQTFPVVNPRMFEDKFGKVVGIKV